MTRINTNVTSLVAQNILGRSNNALQQALNRLSTGLRINTGKDDPAGLIASENLRSDITSIRKAISNTDRANQVIATADSSLGQVSSLLNDIRGLVTESANTGALSDDQIAANQLQIDSSLAALNRIAQTTEFQGRRLLDGSLDFLTQAGTNFSRLSDLSIEQANLGASGSVSVAVAVTTAATQAQVDITGIPAATAAANATRDFSFSHAEVQSDTGAVAATNSTIRVQSVNGGDFEGAAANGFTVTFEIDGSIVPDAEASLVGGTNIHVKVKAAGATDWSDIVTAIESVSGGGDFDATAGTPAGTFDAADESLVLTLAGGRDAGSATITVTADSAGAAGNAISVSFAQDAALADGEVAATINGNVIEVTYDGTVTYTDIAQAINDLTGYSAEIDLTGEDSHIAGSDADPATLFLAGGVNASGGLTQDVVFQLAGKDGVEVFTFQAGTSIADLQETLAAFSDSTGVSATINGTTLELTSTAYGSKAFVDIQILEEAVGGTFTSAIGSGDRETGSDVVATVNGILALGDGNNISLSTTTLALKTTVDAGFTGTVNFDITGGGALFQLGPDVVSNQQARFGITSVNTAKLGGVSGKLVDLKSGESASLANDPTTAFRIVEEAINKVTSLRGRLGSFQRTTLETNKNALGDTLVNLTDAESSIRDADFAAETAALTRAQILVQSGTTVLAIANQNPQNVLALLR
jgi:flagellin